MLFKDLRILTDILGTSLKAGEVFDERIDSFEVFCYGYVIKCN